MSVIIAGAIKAGTAPKVTRQLVGNNRRTNQRYPINMEVSYTVITNRKAAFEGVGQTVDVSAGGVLFDAANQLPAGLRIELSVAWPARLNQTVALNLWLTGTIVRSQGARTAVQIGRYTFRVRGSNRRSSAPGRALGCSA